MLDVEAIVCPGAAVGEGQSPLIVRGPSVSVPLFSIKGAQFYRVRAEKPMTDLTTLQETPGGGA